MWWLYCAHAGEHPWKNYTRTYLKEISTTFSIWFRKEKFFAWLEKHENDIPYLTRTNAAERRKEIMGDVSLENGRKKTDGR